MHRAINLPAGVDYSARAFLSQRRMRVTAVVAATALAALLAAVPVGRGRASVAPASVVASAAPAGVATVAQPTPVASEQQPAAAAPATSTPAEAAPRPVAAAPPAGDLVTRVVIPRIGVDHGIERLGVAADGTMQSPRDGVRGVGWYEEWATPGRGGNAVFSAHESWNLQRGPFNSLRLLEAGDTLTLRMRSGAEYQYVVFSNRRYAVETLPIVDIVWPPAQPGDEEWATFITCGGRYVRLPGGYWDYLDRDVIVAKRVG